MGVFEKLKEPLNSELEVAIDSKNQLDKPSTKKMPSSPNNFLEFVIRTRDLCFGLIALVQLLPVFLVVTLAVYISSGSPIFFVQRRPGKHGKLFPMYKFRTMQKNAEEILRSNQELYRKYMENDCKIRVEEDPRITRVGRFLRRWSLDEIPQFINVVKGDMSFIGPRPVLPEQLKEYGDSVEEFLSVRPGITGLWQVTGRSEVPYPERQYMDLAYIRNRSIYLDAKILLKTVKAVFFGKGAY